MSVPSLTVFIPAYNEEACFEHSVTTIHRLLYDHSINHEIVVVDNGSSDATEEIGNRLQETHSWFRFKRIEERGAGNAFKAGVSLAQAEKIVTLDMDLSSDLLFVVMAYELLSLSDMVIGSKTLGKQRRSLFRILGSQTYILLTNLWLSLTVSDYSLGCKAVKKSQIEATLSHLDGWTGHMLELVLYNSVHGRKVVQIGIDCNDTRQSHFNLFHEGYYRYIHLYKTYKALKNKDSWLHSDKGSPAAPH